MRRTVREKVTKYYKEIMYSFSQWCLDILNWRSKWWSKACTYIHQSGDIGYRMYCVKMWRQDHDIHKMCLLRLSPSSIYECVLVFVQVAPPGWKERHPTKDGLIQDNFTLHLRFMCYARWALVFHSVQLFNLRIIVMSHIITSTYMYLQGTATWNSAFLWSNLM